MIYVHKAVLHNQIPQMCNYQYTKIALRCSKKMYQIFITSDTQILEQKREIWGVE